MKKAIGLAFLTMSLMAGTVTAYAATGSAAVGPGCGQGAYCEEYEYERRRLHGFRLSVSQHDYL